MPKTGIEQAAISSLETNIDVIGGADSGAVGALDTSVDANLMRLVELWPELSADDRLALVAHAEHLVALRDGSLNGGLGDREGLAGKVGGNSPKSNLRASKASGRNTGHSADKRGRREAKTRLMGGSEGTSSHP